MERFSFKKLNRIDFKEQYQVKVCNSLQLLITWSGKEVISWPCECIKENEKLEPKGILSNYESQQHVCSRMLESLTLNEAS